MTFFINHPSLGAKSRETLRKFWLKESQPHLPSIIKTKGFRGRKPLEKLYFRRVHHFYPFTKDIFFWPVACELFYIVGEFWGLLGVEFFK